MFTGVDFYLIKQRFLVTESARRAEWQKGYDQLLAVGPTLSTPSPEAYRRDLDDLRNHWERIGAAYNDLETAEADTWLDAQHRWNTTAEAYRQHYLRTADSYWPETRRPGWMVGYTERLASESEGWVEGLGRQVDDSEGWTEGYEEAND